MLVYNIGNSAVRANQAALQTISNNIANANTEGYHRQQVNLAQANPIVQNNMQFGTGVTVASIQRLINSAADNALTLNLSQSSDAQARLEALRSVEALLTPNEGSLTDSVSRFFDSIEQLATNPADGTLRQQVIAAAQSVSQQVTSLHTGLDYVQQQSIRGIEETVGQINSITSQIASLNQQIKLAQARGTQPNTILDQRDLLVQQLGQLVDITPGSLASPDHVLIAAGGWLVVGDVPQQLSVVRSSDGTLQIQAGDRGPVKPVAGKLAGQLAAHDEIIPEVRDSIREWTSALVSGINSAQATGLGLSGPATFVNGTASVLQSTVPLANAKTLFPVSAGSLFVSVTNSATGERRTHEITIDPVRDSLQDVVDRINGLPNVNSSLSATGQLRINAATGYAIDFAGRPDTSIDTSSITGSAVPVVSGLYEGTTNANWTVTAESTGQIGSTSALKLRVTDATTGSLVAVLDVGSGYVANQPIPVAGGVSIRLNAGTLNAGDHFQLQAIADSDSAGFLTAMGVGGLFQTDNLQTITVNDSIARNPGLLAASRSGNSADATQLQRITKLREAAILSAGSETIEQRLASITSNSGLAVNSFESRLSQLQSQYDQIRNQQDSVSGVDPNEELLAMLQFQRAFQANARFISTINDALDELLGILK
ncbi:flagellar hook-associated protein FlgK [Planctomicrobium sp. SH661]|uniref:flagellar hook-associated protein FlgK n=1 Tax=Planctomicrobium sp. SH661 TaxID=3448124 RepID=UPI003F5BA522